MKKKGEMKMRRKIAVLLLVTLVMTMFAGCGGKETEEAIDSEKKTYEWSMATTYSTGTPMVDAAYMFSEKLSEYSDGQITLNIFPDSALYNEQDSFSAIQNGELEFALFGPTPITMYSPEVGYLLAPFLMQSMDDYLTVYNSEPLQKARETWRTSYNIRQVGDLVSRGWRNLSSTTAINSISDLDGVKLRLPENALWVEAWNTLGATSVAIPLGELYTSLQNGTANASDGPWEQMAVNSLYEVQDYIVETHHYMEVAGFWMSESLYNSLPSNLQEVVDKAGAESLEYMNSECALRDDSYLQKMLDGKCTLLKPDTNEFIDTLEPFFEAKFESTWTATTYDDLKVLLGRQ